VPQVQLGWLVQQELQLQAAPPLVPGLAPVLAARPVEPLLPHWAAQLEHRVQLQVQQLAEPGQQVAQLAPLLQLAAALLQLAAGQVLVVLWLGRFGEVMSDVSCSRSPPGHLAH
jgi:hypothetical protein